MLGPQSEAWRNVIDWRLLLGSGRALLLQVAHPTVGAGVAQYSDFRTRPWQRLQRTIDSLMLMQYGGPKTAGEARRLRELHKDFKGIDHHGNRYHALNPDAYWWVHATLFESTIDLHARFAKPLPVWKQERLYREWRELGETLGVKAHRMPADLTGFFRYFNDVVTGRLEDNESVRAVLAALGDRRPLRPPGWPALPWRVIGPFSSTVMMTATLGTLPPVLRDRLGLQWTDKDQWRLRALQVAVRAGMPLIPEKARYHPMALAAKRAARP